MASPGVDIASLAACCRRYDKVRSSLAAASATLRRMVETRGHLLRAVDEHSMTAVFDPTADITGAAGDAATAAPVRQPVEPLSTLACLPRNVARDQLALKDSQVHSIVVALQPQSAALVKEAAAVSDAVAIWADAVVTRSGDVVRAQMRRDAVTDEAEAKALSAAVRTATRSVAAASTLLDDYRSVAAELHRRALRADDALLGLRAGLSDASDLAACDRALNDLDDVLALSGEDLLARYTT